MNNLCLSTSETNATVRRGIAYLYRLGIVLFVFTLGLTWIPVHAAFPATANPTHEYRLDSASYGIHVIGSTPQDACTQFKDTKPIGSGLSEARARDGARVYFRETETGIKILGKSNKANQETVINEILRIYGK